MPVHLESCHLAGIVSGPMQPRRGGHHQGQTHLAHASCAGPRAPLRACRAAPATGETQAPSAGAGTGTPPQGPSCAPVQTQKWATGGCHNSGRQLRGYSSGVHRMRGGVSCEPLPSELQGSGTERDQGCSPSVVRPQTGGPQCNEKTASSAHAEHEGPGGLWKWRGQ